MVERLADMRAPVPLPVNVDTTGAKIMEDGSSHPDQRDSRDIYLPNHIESVSHIAVDVGGSLAKVVYFTRSRSSSDPYNPRSQQAGPSNVASPSASANRFSSASPLASPSSRIHSRQSSANGVGGHPRSPSGAGSIAGSFSSDDRPTSSHPAPSGTLTPTAILTDQHHHAPPHIGSAVNAMRSSLLKRRSLPAALPGGRLNFIRFETSDIESCVSFLQELIETSAKANRVTIEEMRRGVKLMATGGGAHLFYELFEQALGVEVQREDEMGCLITGLNFITLIPDEVFWYSDELVSALHSPLPISDQDRADPSRHREASASSSQDAPLPRPSPNPPLYAPMFDSHPTPKLPCLLVNIGSGVSIIKVDDYGKFERVSGTSLGGGTLWGLLSLLTEAESFDEMLDLSEKGDNGAVDLLVSDVYGNSNVLNAFGLKSSTIASSFGKVFRKENRSAGAEGRKKRFRPEDICKSLLYAVSNNIGQIAHMTAEKYDLDRIYFGGCFIRGHQATISTLSYAIRFWSKGTKRAFFLRHEGYLGAIGAWIKHLDDPPAVSAANRTASTRTQTSVSQPNGAGTPAEDPDATASDLAPQRTPNHAASISSPPSTSSGFQPAKTMESSGLLPTPIVEAPEPILGGTDSSAATVVPPTAIPGTTMDSQMTTAQSVGVGRHLRPSLPPTTESARGSITANGVQSSQQRSTAPASTTVGGDSGQDLLSMLNSMQVDHRAIVEPLLADGRGHSQSRPMATGSAHSGLDTALDIAPEDEEDLDDAALEELLMREIANGGGAGAGAGGDGESIAELLKKLDAANGAADGLESKLDSLLGRLDGLLAASGVDVDDEGDDDGDGDAAPRAASGQSESESGTQVPRSVGR